jgi:hypothetical protein
VPPEGNCRIFCHSYIKKIKLKNDDADMTNFMLLCMLLGGGFADRYSSRRNQIKVQFAAVYESAYDAVDGSSTGT